jgi:hypothetical protein
MKRIILALLVIGWGAAGGQKVVATENKGLYLSPPGVDITVGSSQPENSFYLEIGNDDQTGVVFDISVVDFGSLDETGGVAFLTVNSDKSERKYALASWISLEKNTVTVEGGKSEKVKVTILNKDSLSPGGHYGAVLATVRSETMKDQDVVGINQSLATLIYALKKGGEIPNLTFKSLVFDKNVFYFSKTVKLRFENSGNVHVVPRGKVEIKNNSGEIVAQGIINADSGKVLPESFRTMELPINRIKHWNWPGIYNMEVDYRYDGLEAFSSVKTRVIYVGFEGAVIVLGLSGVITVAMTLVIRRKTRKVR